MSYDKNNIFAKMIAGEIPCDKVYEDDYVLAFKDLYPQAKVHVLVIPKNAYISIDDFGEKATPEELKSFFQAVSRIAHQLGVDKDGYRVIANHNLYAGQQVFHFHVHILGGQPLGPLVSPF
jgi:histidine triad (HIT) family protein